MSTERVKTPKARYAPRKHRYNARYGAKESSRTSPSASGASPRNVQELTDKIKHYSTDSTKLLRDLRSKNSEKKEHIQHLTRANDELSYKVEALHEKLVSRKKTENKSKKYAHWLKDETVKLSEERDYITGKYIKVKKRETNLQLQITSLKEENNNLRQQKRALQDINSQLREDKTSLRRKNSKLRDGKSWFQSELTKAERERDWFKTENDNLQHELDWLRSCTKKIQNDKTHYRDKYCDAKKNQIDLRKENSRLKGERARMRIDNVKLIEANDKLQYSHNVQVQGLLNELENLKRGIPENKGTKPSGTKCVICLTGGRNVVFLPCGHICTCVACCTRISVCPICRANITNSARVYF